ncbi:LamG domain-containing protein, partial [Flavivirga sp. 57AJ16]|uniref:LamG domain-containing protein n=1 Tax=Flavivirga sp. 57AJ16 TaxID=3025307 RepID=UPI0023653025
MMKNINLKYFSILIIGILFFSCQDLERPEFSDFPYDGPVITLSSPKASSVVRSTEAIATITIQFQVEDDLGIANITVKMDDVEIANINEFADSKLVNVDDLIYDNLTTGSHTLTITATDTNDVVVIETAVFEKIDTPPYTPLFDGEIFYMSFNGDYTEAVSGSSATELGSPSFITDARAGTNAYAGAADSYLTFPTDGLLGSEFSATMWYKINAVPDRAGILVIGPEDTGNANYPDVQNKRSNGFRFFREGGATNQTFKLNVGNGSGDSWFDGGAAATIDPTITTDWVHLAFTISGSECVVYINGEVVRQGAFSGVDWTGCDVLSIMSGAPRFTEWGHHSDSSYMDELRLFNRAITQSDVTNIMAQTDKIFNLSFDGDFTDSISLTDAVQVGTPEFAGEAKVGTNAYAGAADSYLTFPTDGLLGSEFSATMWYKINAVPDRAGILVIGPEDTGNANYPDVQNKRSNGFRFFREGGATNQTFKLNVGNGSGDSWFDGGAAATIDPTITTDWVHLAFTISGSECVVYINGEVVRQGAFSGVDWT